MTNNPLANLTIDYWYKALLVIATCVFIVSLSVEMKGIENSVVQLMSLGAMFIGMGEWINHPCQVRVVPGFKITSFARLSCWFGYAWDITGLVLLIVGIVKLFR